MPRGWGNRQSYMHRVVGLRASIASPYNWYYHFGPSNLHPPLPIKHECSPRRGVASLRRCRHRVGSCMLVRCCGPRAQASPRPLKPSSMLDTSITNSPTSCRERRAPLSTACASRSSPFRPRPLRQDDPAAPGSRSDHGRSSPGAATNSAPIWPPAPIATSSRRAQLRR